MSSRRYAVRTNPLLPSSQKHLDDDAIEDLIIQRLESCIRQEECNNIDNGRITSCDCVARIDDNTNVQDTIVEAMNSAMT